MAILDIRPAIRGEIKGIIGIAGISGSGKTFTALLMARGMVDKASEIGFIDTENGRGSMYADIFKGEQFMIADLVAPFTPSRYSQAIKEFQNAGIKVLVIDSISHEWEGEGGCSDIAEKALLDGKRMADWIYAKKQHKAFMSALLYCNMDVIVCIRAREKTDFRNPSKPVSLGIQPICEKNFMFELTASLLMEDEGMKQRFLKIPAFLKKPFGPGSGYLGIETGKQIRELLKQGEKEDPEITKLKTECMMICELGVAKLKELWLTFTPTQRTKMKPFYSIYEESAKAYDLANIQANQSDDVVITLEELSELFELKKPDLKPEIIADAERIIKGKETGSYAKIHKVLMEI
jgi:hypothetical protein